MDKQSLANPMRPLGLAFLFMLASLTHDRALAQAAEPARAGLVEFAVGSVTITSSTGAKTEAREGSFVHAGDTVATAPGGETHLRMEDGGYLAVRPDTTLRIISYQAKGEKDDKQILSLLGGAIRSVTGWIGRLNPGGYRIVTPSATIGIRGTDHETVHIAAERALGDEIAGTHEWVNRGGSFIERDGKTLEVGEGKAGYASVSGKLALHEKVPAYLERRHTRHEERIERHSREIDRHIEEKLRQHGHVKPHESAQDFWMRHNHVKPPHRVRNHVPPFQRPPR